MHNAPIHFVVGNKTACGCDVSKFPVMIAVTWNHRKVSCLHCLRTRKWLLANSSSLKSNAATVNGWRQPKLFGGK
jgi:hypothetical protein